MHKKKVTIIGTGMVGSTIGYSLVLANTVEDLALVDIDEKLAHAQALDLQHAVPFAGSTVVRHGSYADCADSTVIVVTAGAAQKPGQTRLDLVQKNAAIVREIVPQIFAANPDAIVVMVSNPVDLLTRVAIEMFPDKKHRILGTGTLLDSARLRYALGAELGVSPQSVHAYIVGEHGDSELPLWSTAAVGNMRLEKHHKLADDKKEQIFQEACNAAYAIIEGKQATYYAIGAGCADLVDTILHNRRAVLPVSHIQGAEHGIKGACLSMPAVVGRAGVIETIAISLTAEEQAALERSAQILQETYNTIATTNVA